MFIVNEKLEDYAKQYSTPLSPLLLDLVNETHKSCEIPQMLSGALSGNFLKFVVQMMNAKSILEIGTFTGFSALMMAEGMSEGKLVTCEYDEFHARLAQKYFDRSSHKDKIELILGPALETLQSLEGPFDLVFIDADKSNYPHYYEESLKLLRPGGVILADNCLWSGQVLAPEDKQAQSIHHFNQVVEADERVENVILTIRDGIHFIRKK